MTNGEVLQPCEVSSYEVEAALVQTLLGVCSLLSNNGRQEFYQNLRQQEKSKIENQKHSFDLTKLRQELQSLFKDLGVNRVVLATQNDNKCSYMFNFFKFLELTVLVSGDEMPFLKGVTGYEEPDWKNALAVAWDKVTSVVTNLVNAKRAKTRGKKEKKPDTAVFGGDIVVGWIDEDNKIKYLGNLSREKNLRGEKLRKHVDKLVSIYSRKGGAVIIYEVALVGSIKHRSQISQSIRGVRFEIKLRQVPEEVIRSFFNPKKVGRVLNVAAGVPIVSLDDEPSLYEHVDSVRVMSLDSFYNIDASKGEFKLRHPANIDRKVPFQELDSKEPSTKELLRLAIIGNIPPNVVDLLLDLKG